MRLVSYADANQDWRAGVLCGTDVVDAELAAREAGLNSSASQPGWTSVKTIVAAAPESLRWLAEAAVRRAGEGDGFALGTIKLGPPVPDPEKIICVGLNYPAHTIEFKAPAPSVPSLFAKFPTSLIGPGEPIVLPALSRQIDWEGELAVVIGRTCKSVPEAAAMDVVAGCMAFNDVSARDLQMQTGQWLAGKAIDTFAPSGPWLVSLDEFEDIQSLELHTRVNGQIVQHASTSAMSFSVAEIIAFVSRLLTLKPGDIIATGTPEGVGFRRNPAQFLEAGDVVEVEIEGVGRLSNPVVEAGPDHDAYTPATGGARTGAVSGRV